MTDGRGAPSAGTGRIGVEVASWITRFVGGDGTRRRLFEEEWRAGVTVRDVLHQLGARFPQLEDALWDPQTNELAEHIEVIVNDAVLGVQHSLDSPLEDGDRITLVGAYLGG